MIIITAVQHVLSVILYGKPCLNLIASLGKRVVIAELFCPGFINGHGGL